ncbi:MAG: transposase [Acidobacteria bacterium]|nr:transposase [Acidobacteriota bacterium]MCG3195256.1 IS481 family transposase ISMtsp15 [Thermoanaerobaculia bacterium]
MIGIPCRYLLRVKQRMRVVSYAKENGIRPAARHFALSRQTVRKWLRSYQARGAEGLIPLYAERREARLQPAVIELLRQARIELRMGAGRTRIWLQRIHGIHLPVATSQRTFTKLGVPRLPSRRPRKRRPRQMSLFEKDQPGDSVQVDTKRVRIGRRLAFQFTAIDDCSRYRVLRAYPRLYGGASRRFLHILRQEFPCRIRRIQVDNGTEFPLDFDLDARAAGIEVTRIRPRCPMQDGKVERSHRVDDEESWLRERPQSFPDAGAGLAFWE